MTEEHRQIEATGETVGEAKWSALRELEKLHPDLDKSAVEFQVVSEGERGLLGVGYAPARVIASIGQDAVGKPREEALQRQRHRGAGARSGRADLRRDRCSLPDRDRRGRRGADRNLHRLEPRPSDRKARADDRRDPVPRERDRLAIHGPVTARTSSSTPPGIASGGARLWKRSLCAAPRRRSRRGRESSSSR